MRHTFILFRRDLAAYFLSPTAYFVLLGFQVIACLNFWQLIIELSTPRPSYSSLSDPMSAYISASTPFWIAVLVAVPAITMRLIAEERRSGTIESLLTTPATETEVVLAKWLAGFVMYLSMLVPFALYLPFLYYQANFRFDPGPLVATGVGLATIGMMFVALGVLFSAGTKNQIIAAIWTFVVLFLLIALTLLLAVYAASQRSAWAEAVRYVAILMQVQSFGFGQLDLRYLTLHLSVCVLALYLAVKVLEFNRGR
jgi:ABC-2 type transport system permease protein